MNTNNSKIADISLLYGGAHNKPIALPVNRDVRLTAIVMQSCAMCACVWRSVRPLTDPFVHFSTHMHTHAHAPAQTADVCRPPQRPKSCARSSARTQSPPRFWRTFSSADYSQTNGPPTDCPHSTKFCRARRPPNVRRRRPGCRIDGDGCAMAQ